MAKVFIIDDDDIMADCVELATRQVGTLLLAVEKFTNAIAAISALNDTLPDLIFLDVLLDGPDGFSFLNELNSYSDTAKIPVIIITSLDFSGRDLSHYGVVKILQKETMTPASIASATREVLGASHA